MVTTSLMKIIHWVYRWKMSDAKCVPAVVGFVVDVCSVETYEKVWILAHVWHCAVVNSRA